MGIADRLEGYEVTAVPEGSRSLQLVWSAPPADDVATGETGDESVDGGAAILPILAAYRITRVPGHAVRAS